MQIKVRESINALKPYNVGGRANLSQDWECFDWNESEFPPSNKVFEVMKFIEVYNGSDDGLKDIFTAFVDRETQVISYAPSYTQVDTFISVNTDNYEKVQIIDPLGKHLWDFIPCMTADVVYLVNPNNPTGKLIPIEEIEELVDTNPSTLFVVDEAYYEFAGQSCSHLVISHKNLIVTRTFSKAFGLAAARLGYVMAHPDSL